MEPVGNGNEFCGTLQNRTQYLGNGFLMFSHREFYLPVLAGNELAQGACVRVEKTPEHSGGMRPQELFDMSVKAFGAIV